jgi:hypothetical protein
MTTEFKRQRQLIGSAADWITNDIILGDGELAIALDGENGDIKVGDGLQKFSELLGGAAVMGWDSAKAYSAARSVAWKLQNDVHHIFEVIPPSEHAAILAYTSTYDAITELNAALGKWSTVLLPDGKLRTTRPINMTARRDPSGGGAFAGRRLIGRGATKSIIDAYPGAYACIDLTGSSGCTVAGINFRSDNPPAGMGPANCASVGIMLRRGSTNAYNQNCHQPRLVEVLFNMTSDMARNGGQGTIGLACSGSEHVVTDHFQAYANLPFLAENVFSAGMPDSSTIPSFGAEYEPPFAGSISTTIHEHRSMILIAYDSFRAIKLRQVGNFEFASLYTSTRKLVAAVPANAESFHLDTVANLRMVCYQEVSGKFGATYRMDHRYATFIGPMDGVKMLVRRGALDMGFTMPASPASSLHLENAAGLLQCDFDCNYLIGIYNDSVDNNGFALDPVTYSGTPNFLRGVKLTLDHAGSHSANIFSVIGPYCTDVESVNYLTADTWHQGNGYIDKQLRSTPIVAVPQLGMTGVVTAGFVMGTGYPAGWQCWVYNDSAAPIVITAGAGLTLRLSGTTTVGDRTIAPRARAHLWYLSSGEAIVEGAGVS